MTALSSDDRKCAIERLLERYTRPELRRLLREELNLELEWVVPEGGLQDQLFELVRYAERHQMVGKLFGAASAGRPADAELGRLAQLYPPAQEPARSDEALIERAVVAFTAVPDVLRASPDTLLPLFKEFKQAYGSAANHVDQLRRYKQLHHCLHTIEMKVRLISVSAEALGNPPSRKDAAISLRIYASELRRAGNLSEVVVGLANPGPEQTWLDSLAEAVQYLEEAAREKDPAKAVDAHWLLERIVGNDPSRIQQQIFDHFERIPMAALVFSLRCLQEASTQSAARSTLAEGLLAFEETQRRLGRLVLEHSAWQNLDNSLRVARKSYRRVAERLEEESDGPGWEGPGGDDGGGVAVLAAPRVVSAAEERQISMLLTDLKDVARKYGSLKQRATEARLRELEEYAQCINQAIATRDMVCLLEPFETFGPLVLTSFVEVDCELLTLTDHLTRIGAPLQAILEVLQ